MFGAYQDSQRVQYWGNVDDAKCVTTKEYSDTKFLHKAGGTMTGSLECARPGTGNVLFSVKAQGLPEGNQVAFRITGDGAVKAGHNTNSPFMASLPMTLLPRATWTPIAAAALITQLSKTLPTMSPQRSASRQITTR